MQPRSIAVLLAAILAAAGCSEGVTPSGPAASGMGADTSDARTPEAANRYREIPAEPRDGGRGRSRSGLRLSPFDGCEAFLDHVQTEAAARVQPWGLDPGGFHGGWDMMAVEDSAEATMETMAADEPASTMAPSAVPLSGASDADADGGQSGSGVVGTNVQEQGVDEADIVKTDGTRIVTLSEGVLTNVDISSGRPVETGSLELPESWGAQLFLHGSRAYVITTTSLSIPVASVPAPPTTAPVETAPPTAPSTAPTSNEPPVSQPVVTEPPVTEPPVTEPPVTEPPVTEPPVTEPPVTEPPVTEPPVTDRPVTEPVTEPPVTEPPVTEPIWTSVQGVAVIEIDLAGNGGPAVVSTVRVEGWLLSARLIGGRLLIATTTPHQWQPSPFDWSAEGDEAARERNRQTIVGTGLATWTPQYEVTTPMGTTQGDLLPCDRIHHPADFAGFDLISLIDLDVTAGLPADITSTSASGVLASGQTVYASLDRFYVATTRWFPFDVPMVGDAAESWNETYSTDVHAFSITAGAPVAYVASGSVAGSLRNQFSMSEHQGFLRIFTTTGSPWGQTDSETQLVVLGEADERLEQVGAVGGLGRGETLYSARMIGDRGFAVTFRQIDPFYVLDLSNPAAPAVTGELKIPGFSTYLHPVGEHRVLGVGKAATDDGQVTGFKLSLFDVGDPANPIETATWTMDGTESAAEYDHRAFQMIGSTAVLPIRTWATGGEAFNGAVLFEIGDTITEVGRITHVGAVDAPTTDCRVLGPGDISAEGDLAWMTADPWTTVQLCDADDTGGYGTAWCETVRIDALDQWWFGDPGRVAADLTALGAAADDRLELCYRQDDGWEAAILRSIAVDGTLYTMSTRQLHAHDLATLTPIASIDIT
jgi:hypothetical protein